MLSGQRVDCWLSYPPFLISYVHLQSSAGLTLGLYLLGVNPDSLVKRPKLIVGPTKVKASLSSGPHAVCYRNYNLLVKLVIWSHVCLSEWPVHLVQPSHLRKILPQFNCLSGLPGLLMGIFSRMYIWMYVYICVGLVTQPNSTAFIYCPPYKRSVCHIMCNKGLCTARDTWWETEYNYKVVNLKIYVLLHVIEYIANLSMSSIIK